MKKERLALMGLFTIALIWGFAFIAVDYALENGWQTFSLLAMRGFIASLLLLPLAIKKKFWRDRKMLLHASIAGIFFFFGYAFQTLGQAASNVVNSAFYTCLYVIFTPFLAFFIAKKKVKWKTYLSAILAIIGVFVLNYFASGEQFTINKGDIYLMLCAVMFALQIVWIARFMDAKSEALSASFVMLLVMGVLSMFAFFISDEKLPESFKGFEGVLFAAIFSSGIASILQFICQRYTTASKASLILSLETTFACVFAWFSGADFNWYSVLGLVLIMSAVVVSNVSFKKKITLNNIEFLLFDVDDTLLDFQKTEKMAFKKVMRHYQIPYKKVYYQIYHAENKRLWQAYEKKEINRETIFNTRFKKLVDTYHFSFDYKEASYLLLDYLGTCPYLLGDAKEVIKKLAEKYRLIIISNGEAKVQYPRLKALDMEKYFEKIYISSVVGSHKPNQAFFDYIEKDLSDFDKNKALVIGDSLTSDMQGGINAGIKTCWFNPKGKTSSLNIDYVIKDLEELL